MLPAVRPATLLVTAAVVTLILTALSVWVRVTALDPVSDALFGQHPPTGFAVAYRLFDADGEGNVPAWFSVLLLAMTALFSLGVSSLLRDRGAPLRRYWTGLAAVFLYLSVDELAMVHEELMPRLEQVVEAEGALTFSWVVVAAPLVAVFVLVYARFLWRLPRDTAALLVLAGALYVGGALGLEVVGGMVLDEVKVVNLAYVLVTSAEEFLEMAGAALALYTVARYARSLMQDADGGLIPANGSVTSISGETKPPAA
ncbi:hypothetical protein [Candidatus Blastococcus massiliensis]|uniref:hypothetical protein n=1 Tax=Candidatus Blastococcus massiliensis TaxID=1470358 RepID=UPI0004AD90E7|nr:hypothetical protein [Candidatus Blastococcus massiliensis]